MTGQERVRKHHTTTSETEPAAVESNQTADRDAEVDALLDEIDDVLETNAEEFVASFVQKGGQ